MPMTLDRLTGIVSSSRTTVIDSGPTDLIAHSTNSWAAAEPTTRRSLSMVSGSADNQAPPGDWAASSACLQATLRTLPTGISPRPSGRESVTTVPSQARSSPSIHEPSTSATLTRPAAPRGAPSRSTSRTVSIGTTSSCPAESILKSAPSSATSVPEVAPASVFSIRSERGSPAPTTSLVTQPIKTAAQIGRHCSERRHGRLRRKPGWAGSAIVGGDGVRIECLGSAAGDSPGARPAPVMESTRRRRVA